MPDTVSQPTRPSFLKRYLPRTLLWRSFLIILLPLLLLQIAATWFFYDRHYSLVTRRLAQWSAGSVAMIADTLERQPNSATIENLEPLARRALLMTLTFEPEGRLPEGAASTPSGYLERYLSRAMNQTVQRPYIMDSDSLEEFVKLDIQLSTGVLTVLVRKEHLFTDTSYIFIIWMVGSSMVLFAVAMIFMRNQVRSIRRLAQAANSFGRGLDVTGFKPEGAAEVRQAAQAFLQMRQRIKRQIQQRTEMLAGVSHDLRTPLTRMKLELALMPKSTEVEALAADLAEMEHMIEGYLTFARGEGSEPPAELDLGQLLADVAEQAKRGGHDIKLSSQGEYRLTLRPAAIRRCLNNLLENAARYGKHVEVHLRQDPGWVEILIDDDGPGIPAAHREAVFKPFFRLDPARNPDRGGSGLGLTIARDVARGHGGEIVLEDSPLGGLRVRLRLPA